LLLGPNTVFRVVSRLGNAVVLEALLLGQKEDGHWVTIDEQPVFIGGPGEGAGGIVGSAGPQELTGNAEASNFLDDITSRGWKNASGTERGAAKNALVTAISAESGVDYDTVNQIVRQWSQAANDTNRASLELQKDASEMFGVPLSPYQLSHLGLAKNTRTWDEPIADSATQKRVLKGMYDHTQRELERAGFGPNDPITLYRGFAAAPSDFRGERGQTVPILTNVMSSWSVAIEPTRSFASGEMGERRGGDISYSVRSTIPRWRIIGSARTGFGCLTEGEFIVLGNPESPDYAYIESSSSD
jgi:hypothetical protein